MQNKHILLIQLMCRNSGNRNRARQVTSFESFSLGILLLRSHPGFTGTFQYSQVLWRAQWVQKAVHSLVHSTCLIQTFTPSLLILGWHRCFACSRCQH